MFRPTGRCVASAPWVGLAVKRGCIFRSSRAGPCPGFGGGWGSMHTRGAAIILAVPEEATIELAREAYRSHARLLQPDRLGDASEADKQAPHRTMARINDAYAVFQSRVRVAGVGAQSRSSAPEYEDRASRYQRPEPPPESAHQQQQPQEGRQVAQFDARLSHARGWDLTGVLSIIRTHGGYVSAVFESDDLDARGAPVFEDEIFVAPGMRAPRDGTLALYGGGYLVLRDLLQVKRLLTHLGLDVSLAKPKSSGLWGRLMRFKSSNGAGHGWYRN